MEPPSALEVVLLVVHVLGAVLFVGPATVANSVFPIYLRGGLPRREAAGADRGATAPDLPVLVALHRISRRYGRNALVVPVAGAALASLGGRWDEAWLLIAVALTAVAAVLLVVTLRIQRAAVAAVRSTGTAAAPELVRRAGIWSGNFNLTWVLVLVLMVWRPGGAG